MLLFYRLYVGYVRVMFSGEYYEKILDITARNRITLWDSRLVKNGIESSMTIKDFKRLRGIIKDKGIKVHILKKRGLPFFVEKNKKRIGLLSGLIFFLIFLNIMSGYIWIVDVEGNNYVKKETILSLCREIGIEEGIKKDSINPKRERQKLLLKTDSLAWASLNIEGSRLTVNESEVQRTDKNTDAYNIKADADGIITKIDVTNGTCVVSVGDVVKKGDLLVSGVVEESGKTKFVNATGKIYAQTINEFEFEEKANQMNYIETGETEKRYVLEFFTLKIPLYLGSVKSEYRSITDAKTIKLFGSTMPIRIYEKEYIFLQGKKVTLENQELTDLLKERLQTEVNREGVSEAVVQYEEFSETEDGMILKAGFKAVEDITYKEAILKNDSE